jgi:glycosyltransferase involved in cell wall biosynthesis
MTQEKKIKIAFVIPWFGKDIGGGAEAECKELVYNIKKLRSDIEVEVITTALKEFAADWNENTYQEGKYTEDGVVVWRFSAKPVDRTEFHPLNYFRLMAPQVDDLIGRKGKLLSPLTSAEEKLYSEGMINSRSMYKFLKKSAKRYDFFVFIPYMFGPSFNGSALVGDRAVIIPCLHNERYAYMKLYQKMMKRARATLYHVEAEMVLARKIYDLKKGTQFLIGEMVDTNPPRGDEKRFRAKHKVENQFLLYAGRKIVGKNLPLLVRYFEKSKSLKKIPSDLKLVLIGKGDLEYNSREHPDIIDLGFLTREEKNDAYAAALVLCQPSLNESFSIVMMESWLQNTPVLVSANCAVTKEHITRSGGGYFFSNENDFAGAVEKIYNDREHRKFLAQAGKKYVLENYTNEVVINKLADTLFNLKSQKKP